jgi:hypothetical protein
MGETISENETSPERLRMTERRKIYPICAISLKVTKRKRPRSRDESAAPETGQMRRRTPAFVALWQQSDYGLCGNAQAHTWY